MRKTPSVSIAVLLATLVLAALVVLIRLGVLGAAATGVAVGDRPPAFSLPDVSGRIVRFTPDAGKVQVLNFFASWCGPCKAETPFLVRTASAFGGRVRFFGVDLTASEPDLGALTAFVARYRVPYPVLLDTTGKVSVDYAVAAIPTTFVVGADGRIVAVWRQRLPEAAFLATLRSAAE